MECRMHYCTKEANATGYCHEHEVEIRMEQEQDDEE